MTFGQLSCGRKCSIDSTFDESPLKIVADIKPNVSHMQKKSKSASVSDIK